MNSTTPSEIQELHPSDLLIEEVSKIQGGEMGYLLTRGDYINGSNLILYGLHTMEGVLPNDRRELLASTVEQYWNYLNGNKLDTRKLISTASIELQTRARVVNLIISEWNTLFTNPDNEYQALLQTPEYKNLSIIADRGPFPHATVEGIDRVRFMLDEEANFMDKICESTITQDEKKRLREAWKSRSNEFIEIYNGIPRELLDVGIKVNDPERGVSYKLYPALTAGLLINMIRETIYANTK